MGDDYIPPYRHLGILKASQTATSVAAPVFAGFAFALIAIVLTAPSAIRWPSASVALLVTAALALVGCTQFALAAQLDYVSPQEEIAWFGSAPEGKDRLVHVKAWSDRAGAAYNSGLVLLLDAVLVLIVPSASIDAGRWLAVAVALTASCAETSALVSDQLRLMYALPFRIHGLIHLLLPAAIALVVAIEGSPSAAGVPAAALAIVFASTVLLAVRNEGMRRQLALLAAVVVVISAIVTLAAGHGASAVACYFALVTSALVGLILVQLPVAHGSASA